MLNRFYLLSSLENIGSSIVNIVRIKPQIPFKIFKKISINRLVYVI